MVCIYYHIKGVAYFLPRTSSASGVYLISVGVHVYVCGQKKLNHTLAIDLPFQILVVDFSFEFID